jgi:hypothetical protein
MECSREQIGAIQLLTTTSSSVHASCNPATANIIVEAERRTKDSHGSTTHILHDFLARKRVSLPLLLQPLSGSWDPPRQKEV